MWVMAMPWLNGLQNGEEDTEFRTIYCIVAGARVVKVNLNINSRSWERLVGIRIANRIRILPNELYGNCCRVAKNAESWMLNGRMLNAESSKLRDPGMENNYKRAKKYASNFLQAPPQYITCRAKLLRSSLSVGRRATDKLLLLSIYFASFSPHFSLAWVRAELCNK